MKQYLKVILPTSTQWISFLVLPVLFAVYFLVTSYSDQFIKTQGVDYVAIQGNVLATLYISGTLGDWMKRFMDFAFWGVLATIGVLIWWGVGVAKTSVQNHSTVTEFTNFQTSQKNWRQSFVAVAVIKTVLIVVIFYAVIALLAKAIPYLALGVASCVQGLTGPHLQIAIKGVLLMVFWQFVIAAAVKLFKITRAE